MSGHFDPGEWLAGLVDFFDAAVRGFLPRLALAIAAMLLGWVVAVIVRRLLRVLLRWMKVDHVYDRSGLKSVMARSGADGSLAAWIAQVGYLLVIVAALRMALVQVGLEEMVGMIDTLFLFIPTLLAVLLIILFGGILQRYLSRAVAAAAEGLGIEYAAGLGRFASAVIILLVAMLALAQFGIETRLIESLMIAVLASLGLGAALSFGLGTRDFTKEIVAGLYIRRIVEVGERVEVNGRRGVLKAVSPVTALLEDDRSLFSVPNSVLLFNLNLPEGPESAEPGTE